MILLMLSLAACTGLRPEPPEVQLAGLEITEMSLSHANFLATLKLFNPNNIALDIETIKFTLFLNEVLITKGLTATGFSLPAEESGEAAIRLSTSFLNLFQLTRELQDSDKITFRIAGEVKIGGFGLFGATIPLESEGTLPLSRSLNQLRPTRSLTAPESI